MHGNVSRSKRRSATAEDWLTPQQQFEKALELFQPAPEDREEFKSAIAIALRIVQDAKKAEAKARTETKSVRKKNWNNAIKKLRAVETAADRSPGLIDKEVVDATREERILLECFGPPKVRKVQHSGDVAAAHAWALLGGGILSRAGLTEGGTWHQLAAILFGYATADLFNFDCLRRLYSLHTKLLRGEESRSSEKCEVAANFASRLTVTANIKSEIVFARRQPTRRVETENAQQIRAEMLVAQGAGAPALRQHQRQSY